MVQVTRQPSVTIALSAGMARPSKFRNLVSRYCVGFAKSRRKRLTREFVPADVPPPPPPKDSVELRIYAGPGDEVDAGVRHEYITHAIFLAQDMSTVSWSQQPPQPTQTDTMQRASASSSSAPRSYPTLPRSAKLPQMLSPAEIRQRRLEASLRGRGHPQSDTQDTLRAEAEHKARQRLERERLDRQLALEEEHRKLALEEDLRLAARLRVEKEERERREEEEKHQKLEARRTADRERRIRQAQKMQEWREGQARQLEEETRRKAQMRHYVHEERKLRPITTASSVSDDVPHEESFHCWVTMQKCDNVAWRRRFCRVQQTQLLLFKDATASQPMEHVDISSVRALKERADDQEELEGLSHAFALHAEDGVSYILFTDNNNDKETLISLIVQTAGI